MPQSYYLKSLNEEKKVSLFKLPSGECLVGRDTVCQINLNAASKASRKHCKFITSAASVRMENLSTTNGTYVNGKKIEQVQLKPGDKIQVGDVLFELLLGEI